MRGGQVLDVIGCGIVRKLRTKLTRFVDTACHVKVREREGRPSILVESGKQNGIGCTVSCINIVCSVAASSGIGFWFLATPSIQYAHRLW
jgi:hypothetical protein